MLYFILGLMVATAFLAFDMVNNIKAMLTPEPVPVRAD